MNAKEKSKQLAKRSAIFDQYPEAFVEAVTYPGTTNRLPNEIISISPVPVSEQLASFAGIDSPDSFGAKYTGQMRLSAIEKEKMKRERDRAMEELQSILDRVRLATQEFLIAEAELTIAESPEPGHEVEENEQKARESRNNEIENPQGQEEKKQDEREALSGADEDLSESSDEGDRQNQLKDGEYELEEAQLIPELVESKDSERLLLKQAKRRRVLKIITSYLDMCIEREDIMRQMQAWIETTVDEELSKPARIFLFSPELLLDDVPTGLAGEIGSLGGTLTRLKSIADSLGIGGTKEEEQEILDEVAAEKALVKFRGPRAKVVFNVDELDSSEHWSQAEAEVDNTLKQAVRVIPVRKVRLSVDHARKQFLVMSQLMGKRNEIIRQFDEKVIDLEAGLVKAKKQTDDLKKNNKKTKVRADKFQHQCEDLQKRLNERQKAIDELNEKLEEFKKKESFGLYKSSSDSMASLSKDSSESVSVISLVEKPSQQLGPTGEKLAIQSPKSSKTQAVVVESQETKNEELNKLKESLQRVQDELKVEKEKSAAFEVEFSSLQSDKVKVEQERSDLEIQLEDAKRENERAVEELNQKIEDFERENKRLTGEIECNEEMIKYQEERMGQFMEEIQSLEERMMSFPPTPATTSVMSMAGTQRRERRKTSLQLGLEPQTARQMVAKVKQQYEAELQSLKDHMAKENLRHQAEIRRLDQDHKKDVQNIHKEALLLLRALNRFKDCVATLLDREHLPQEAHAIRSHAPLPLDENFGDTRQMLARMAILSNEMLISVELHLSRGLMSKRLGMKDTGYVRMDQQSADFSQKMKDYGSMQMVKGKRGREQFQGQQMEFQIWRLLEEGKRQEVMERVRELIAQIATHEKEIQSVKKAGEESFKKKDDQMKRVLARESDIKKMTEEQKTIIKNLASIWKSRRIGQKYIRRQDQQRNLKLLEEAMKENEIPSDLYKSTKKLIKEAMEFPRKRLIEIVTKYVHFRRMKEINDNVQRMKMESNIDERVLQAMRDAEERMRKQKETWRLKKETLIKERADILDRLHQVLTQVHEETGLLLTKPMDLIPRLEDIKEDVKEIKEEDISNAVNIPKERAKLRKEQLQAQAVKDQPLTTVDGTGVTSEGLQGATWKVTSTFPPAMITTPKLLHMDINRSRSVAQEVLLRLSQGSLDKKSVSLPPATFFPSLYGYYKRPDDGIRKIRSEPSAKPKNTIRTLRSKVKFLPPIATLYPGDEQKDKDIS